MNLRTIILVLVLLSFLSTSIGGYIYYSSLQKSSLEAAHNKASELVEDISGNIDMSLAEYQKSVKAMAGIDEIRKSLLKNGPDTLKKANAILDHFYNALSVNVCYLLDNKGNTIASSNRNSPQSFVGKNYAFRPYFKEAINGKPSIYMALGVTSGTRGIYYGRPVYGEDQETPIGVVVIKTSMEEIERRLFSQNFIGTMSLIDPHGVIFASSREEWLYQLLWNLSEKEIFGISRSRQFGNGPWSWIGMEIKNGQHAVDSSGNEYHIHKKKISFYPGWNLIYLHDHQEVYNRVANPLFKSAGYIILSLTFLISLFVAVLFRLARRDINRRERAEEELRLFRNLIDQSNDSVFVIEPETGSFLDVNEKTCTSLGYSREEMLEMKVVDIEEALPDIETWKEHTKELKEKEFVIMEGEHRRKDGTTFPIEINVRFIIEAKRNYMVAVARDITERKKAENDREELIDELKGALDEVKALSGLLPICFSCKKIRDDDGYWNQIEVYIRDRSDADFSHGICPDCAKKLYPKYFDDDSFNNNEEESDVTDEGD